jgi:hypothetical protein
MTLVERLLQHDAWAASDGETDGGPFILRFRTPVMEAGETEGHPRLVVVCWPYAPDGAGAMPDDTTSSAMGVFEDRICAAWECDCLAVLAAVLTFDGARQWVWYTHNVDECGKRLNDMPQEVDAYPIELTTEEDPDWNYLRDQILMQVNWKDGQQDWHLALEKASNEPQPA